MKYLFALALILISSSCFADMVTISGTGLFNTSLGTLNKVTVRFQGTNVSMGTTAAHDHTIAAGQQVNVTFTGPLAPLGFTLSPFTTSDSGLHTHSFTIPSFTWNGLGINLGSTVSSGNGLHSHTVSGLTFEQVSGTLYQVSSPGVTTSSSGAHSQTFSFDKDIVFTGTDLNTFLSGSLTSSYNLNFSIPGDNHSHQVNAGTYSIGGGSSATLLGSLSTSSTSTGTHAIDFTNDVVTTTFEYTPFSAIPEPSSFVLLSFAAGAGAVGRRFWKKRKTA